MKQKEETPLLNLIQKMNEKICEGAAYEEVEKMLEDFQQESFMEGYCYAIEVLKNGIVKKKTE